MNIDEPLLEPQPEPIAPESSAEPRVEHPLHEYDPNFILAGGIV